MRAFSFALLLVAAPASAATLPEGGTIVFLGDSVTWQNLYVRYIEGFLLRGLPARDLTVVNRGVRGDTASKALARLDRDVLPHDPALVIIMLGVNDGGFKPPSGVLLSRYLRTMEKLVIALRRKTRAQVLLLTPTCVDPSSEAVRAYNETLALMSRELVALAMRLEVDIIDINSLMNAVLKPSLMADSLHPGPAGHALIARWILDALIPGGVSTGFQVEARGCRAVQFSLSHPHNNALVPTALASLNAHVVEIGDATCELELVVDRESLGHFGAEAWREGVDLNRLHTAPWVREAEHVDRLLQEKWRWVYALWDPRNLGIEALDRPWRGSRTELRARAERELGRIRARLRTARVRVPVTYPTRLLPQER